MDTALIDFIMAAEGDELSAAELVEGVFLHRETLMRLQGSWQRITASITSMVQPGADWGWWWTAPDGMSDFAESEAAAIDCLVEYLREGADEYID